jgi:histidyl-tRNA synthetase
MFAASGISSALFKTVSSSVDKLDKQPWMEIREELIKEKGLDERAVDNLGHFVRIKGFLTYG